MRTGNNARHKCICIVNGCLSNGKAAVFNIFYAYRELFVNVDFFKAVFSFLPYNAIKQRR